MEDNGESENDHNEAEGAGGDDALDEGDINENEQHFDISLPALHSYMGGTLVAVRGRCVLDAGWVGRVPVMTHYGTIFPGETVPMLLHNAHDAAVLAHAVRQKKLFGFLFPDESGELISGYGVLCEVFEMRLREEEESPSTLTFKARANHRFRLVTMPQQPLTFHMYARMRTMEVRVLPEVQLGEPLRPARLASLDALRRGRSPLDERLRAMDAAVTPWPLFVYDMFDYSRMRQLIQDYFKKIMFEKLPEDPVSLSFWAASNLALSSRDRLALFVVDNALLRLHMELRFISRKSALCCTACLGEIARKEHIFAMSSEGVHSNYTNLGGYMHDIVTVSRATHTVLNGGPTAEYSWFPGYTWTIMYCVGCMAHVGWRFDALKRNLRPQQFYGLCRNYVQPHLHAEPEAVPWVPHPSHTD